MAEAGRLPDAARVNAALFAAYPDALLLVDSAGHIVQANAAAATLFGYTVPELCTLSVDALVPSAVRASHAAYRAAYAQAPRARPMGTQIELVAQRRDGSEVMVEIALSPLPGLQPPLVVAAVRGIGAYPRVRQALQRARYSECVAEIGRLAVDTRDPQQLLREAPAAAARTLAADMAVLYRVEPGALALRVAARHGLDGFEREGTLRPNDPDTPWGHALARGEPLIVEDYRSERRFSVPPEFLAQGLVSAISVPLADRGRVAGLLAVRSRRPQHFGADEVQFMQSLANLLASSLQRAESEEALAHAARMESIGQLTGGIAHDFNNLLTIIQGNLQVLDELPSVQGDEGAREMVAAASRAGRRGAELTAKLLAFSRRQLLQPNRVDTAALLGSLADMLRRTLDPRIRIAVEVAPDCPPLVADAAQLESALLNLAINARDAMPDGGLLAFGARADGDQVAIAVADTGCGMPDEVRERAFEPFFTTKAKGRGTGLGLATVYGFVAQSRGTVEIDSAPGRGTTLTLRIPRWRDTGHEAEDLRAAAPAALPPGFSVLLVEDDAEVRQVVASFLRALGAAVHAVADADAALAALTDGAPCSLLLTDIALGPGLRGTDLAQRVQAARPALPVLLMSGYASEARGNGSTAALPWELLRKPFTREELARAMARLLG